MDAGKHDVFISYRRDGGGAEARLIRSAFSERGLNVFLDVTDLKQGHFDLTLLSRIAEARIFLLVLSPHTLDRCADEQDWLRREIAQAIQTGRNIIPVMLPGFEFPEELPPEIKDLPRHQAVEYSHTLFDATINKLLDAIGGVGGRALKPKIAYYTLADYLWKRLGARGILPLIFVVALPIGAYSFLKYAVNYTIPRLAGDFGVEFEAEDWRLHPFSLTGVAHKVRLRPPLAGAAAPVFTADEVEFSGSLGTVLSGLGSDLLYLATLGGLDFGQPFNEIRIKGGELHLEVSQTGHLNWTDFWDAVPQKRKDQFKKGLFPVNAVFIDRLKVSYLEHIPGHSGGGVIQRSQAHIDIDDVTGSITDLARRGSPQERVSKFRLTGRSAGGVIVISGDAAFSPPNASAAASALDRSGAGVKMTAAQSPQADVPYFPYFPTKMDIFLENIGAAAFATMIPDATGVVATRGSLRGRIGLDVAGDHYNCVSNVEMNDVRLAPNPRVIVVKSEFDRLQRDLDTWQTSGKFEACKPFDEKPSQRPSNAKAPILLAAFTAQATVNAPPSVRSAVARDQQGLTGVSAAEAPVIDVVGKLGEKASQRVATILGPQTGRLVQQALSGRISGQPEAAAEEEIAQPENTNPITKGAIGVGRGIKKIFGRDKKKKEPKPSDSE